MKTEYPYWASELDIITKEGGKLDIYLIKDQEKLVENGDIEPIDSAFMEGYING